MSTPTKTGQRINRAGSIRMQLERFGALNLDVDADKVSVACAAWLRDEGWEVTPPITHFEKVTISGTGMVTDPWVKAPGESDTYRLFQPKAEPLVVPLHEFAAKLKLLWDYAVDQALLSGTEETRSEPARAIVGYARTHEDLDDSTQGFPVKNVT